MSSQPAGTVGNVFGAERERLIREHDRALVDLWRIVSAWLAEPGDRSQAPRQLERIGELCRLIREHRARLHT